MVDIHSHILPGLDDGSRSLEQSVAMLRIAAENGTTDIVATPHANPEYRFQPDQVERLIAEVQSAIGPSPCIHYGCDFHLTFENIDDALRQPGRYTVGHGRYLMVEFSDLLIFPNQTDIFERLLDAGIVPVVTHPERNLLLQQRLDSLKVWAEMGCLLQVTAASYLGRFGRKAQQFSTLLTDQRLVHAVASDAHDDVDRSPDLAPSYRHVRRRWGRDWADLLFTANPGAIVRSEPLPEPPEPRRRWFHFWN